jgi:hypothetical protein
LLVGLLQIGHLFFPINRDFSASLLAGTGVLAIFALLFSGFGAGWTRRNCIVGGAALLLLVAISLLAFVPAFNCCTKEMYHYDLGLYYLKTIRWTESFPVVRGLVNVQPHLGFNHSAFLVTSFVDSLVPDRRSLSLIGGILPWSGLSLSLFAMVRIVLFRLLKNKSVLPPIEVAYAISIPAWLFALAGGNVTSASPDSVFGKSALHIALLAAPVFLNVAVWFFTAPDPRYLGSTLWLFAICPALVFVAAGPQLGLTVSVANLCASAVPMIFLAWDCRWNWSYPEPRLPAFKTVELNYSQSNHGVTVWFPAKGDQTFDGPIPSSKEPRPDVAYIDPKEGIGGGFKYLKVKDPAAALTSDTIRR